VLAKVLIEVANDLPAARATRLGKAMAEMMPGRLSWRTRELAALGFSDGEWCRKERREVVTFTGDSERVREVLAQRAKTENAPSAVTSDV